MSVAYTGTITGRVQGVGFRWSTARQASRLGVTGWVRNLPDGRVEFFVQGSGDAVEDMKSFLHAGPPSAVVADVAMEETDPDPDLSRFDIR